MDEYLKQALEIVKAQAQVRQMTVEEITAMVNTLATQLKAIMAEGACCGTTQATSIDSKKSIKEKSITCLECGKSFKIITKKHLAQHGMDKKAYLEKHGLKKGTVLASKGLTRARKAKMKDMRLWEKRAKESDKAKKETTRKTKA